MESGLKVKILPRSRIFRSLDQVLSHPLSLIVAPMGYGKTASLRSFISERQVDSIWITIPKSANMSETDLIWFLLVRAISKRNGRLSEKLSQFGFPNNSIEVFRIVDLLEALEQIKPILIVIDDLHFIEDGAVYDLIYQIVSARIPWLHIVILSRSYPRLPLAEMELKGELFMLGPQELAFTREEMEEYLALIQFNESNEVKKQLFAISQGWISSIFLLAAGYLMTGRLDDNASINDMFNSSLFSHYTQDEQRLLTQLALLDSFGLKMAEYVFDDPSAPDKIKMLYRTNAFIFHDQQGKYYFHQMFKDFLLSSRSLPTFDNRVFLDRAAQWYNDKGSLTQAIYYWMMANNREKIMETLELLPPLEVATLNIDPLASYFNDRDETRRFQYPYAFLKNVFYQIVSGNSDQSIKYLNDFDLYFSTHTHERYSSSQLLGESAVLRSSFAFNDLEKMMQHIKNAQNLLKDKKSLFRTRNSSFTHTSPHLTYGYFNKIGNYKSIVDIFTSEFYRHIQVTDGCGAGCVSLAQAEYALETLDLVKVEALAFQSINEAKPFEQNRVIIGAYLTLARLYYLQGRRDRLVEIKERVLFLKKDEMDSATLYEIDNCMGYISGLVGETEGIPAWIRSAELPQGRSMFERLSFNLIVSGKTLLLDGDFKKLERKTYQFDHYFSSFSYQLGFIHNWIYRAIAKFNLYGSEIGCSELKNVIEIATPDHIIAPFIENMNWIAPMLKEYKPCADDEAIIDQLMACGQYEIAIGHAACHSVLTNREIEIIEYLNAGYSQADIARELYIAHNTVKRHLQNIYQKLGVSNKTQAINEYKNSKRDS